MTLSNLTGQILGQYELRELVGAGGMGAVYRAYQRKLERAVAVKILSTQLAAQKGYVERFYREAKTSAQLEHTNIVPVYDYGMQRDLSYVVMRLLSGGTLAERMQRREDLGKPLPTLREVADLLRQMASALDYAHSQGVIHRDIKPSNIMFDSQGSAYLVDFGIAKLTEATSALTGTGTTMGTPAYMPPEQWRSETLTPTADQYALGATIYFLVAGKVPFEATTPFGLMHKHINEPLIPPHHQRADLPEAISLVLERALAKAPGERFPTMTAFFQAFESASAGTPREKTGFFTMAIPRKLPPATEVFAADTGDQAAHAPSTAPSPAESATPAPTPAGATPTPASQAAQQSIPVMPATGPQPRAGRGGSRGLIAIAGFVLVAAVIVIALLILGGDDGGSDDPQASGDDGTPVAGIDDEAATATAMYDSPILHATPVETPTAPQTATLPPTESPTDEPEPTSTPQAIADASQGPPVMVVGTDEVNVYQIPSTDAPVVAVVRDEQIPIIGKLDNGLWYQIPGADAGGGWVEATGDALPNGDLSDVPVIYADSFVYEDEGPLVVVGASSVELREAPHADAATVAIMVDMRLPVTGISADGAWYQVTYEEQDVWLRRSASVDLVGDVADLPVIDVQPVPAEIVPVTITITPMGTTLRDGPGFNFNIVRTVIDTTLDVIGISADGSWFLVAYEDGGAWLRRSALTKVAGTVDALPVFSAGDEPLDLLTAPETAVEPVTVTLTLGTSLRDGPGFDANIVRTVSDVTLDAIGISADGAWLLVAYEDGGAWLRRSALTEVAGTVDALPVFSAGDEPLDLLTPEETTPDTPVTTDVIVTVTPMGAQLRGGPGFDADIVRTVVDVSLNAIGISADGSWFLVTYDDGGAWIRRSAFVDVSGPIDTLPVFSAGDEPLDLLTPEQEPTAEIEAAVTVQISALGANLRDGPSFDAASSIVAVNVELRVVGVNASGEWFLVEYPVNQRLWLRRSAGVVFNGDTDLLPVVEDDAAVLADDAAFTGDVVAVIGSLGANLRHDPSFSAGTVSIAVDVALPVIGRTEAGAWFLVEFEGQELWVRNSAFVTIEGDLDSVPIIDPAAAGADVVAVIGPLGANLRHEPSFSAGTVAVAADVALPVIGRTEAGDWFLVAYEGQELWVRNSAFVTIEGDLDSVPIIDPAAAGAATTGTVLFADDFERGHLGEWTMWEGEIVNDSQADGNRVMRITGAPDQWPGASPVRAFHNDYAVQVRVMVIDPSLESADVYLRVRAGGGEGMWYNVDTFLNLSEDRTGIGYYQAVNDSWTGYGEVHYPLTTGAWYEVRVEVIGEEVHLYLNGDLQVVGVIAGLGDGTVNIGGGPGGTLLVDDVTIWAIDTFSSD